MKVGSFQCAIGYYDFRMTIDCISDAFHASLYPYFMCPFMHISHAFGSYGSYIFHRIVIFCRLVKFFAK